MNPLPITITITPPATSHPRRRHQGPLDNTWRSLYRHHRCRPPSPSLSATATIVTIMGLVVAWCRLPPPSSSSLSSNAAATLPTTESTPPHPHSPPPPIAVAPSPPSRLPMAPSWTGMQHRRPPVRCGECRTRPPPLFQKTGKFRQCRRHGRRARCIGLLSGGWR
jgi:hypothetical protein